MSSPNTTSANAIASFTDLVDLANERLGGAAIHCTDDFFAGMDNLVKAKEAVWLEDAYTDLGKWMDGWESRRSHRENHGGLPEHHDSCIIRLGAPGVVRGIVVDTAFFRGNFPSHCAIEGASVTGYPSGADIADTAVWHPLVEKSALEGNAKNSFAVSSSLRVTHVRLRIFPDGGVARLRVFGEPLPDWSLHGGLAGELDLAAAELGGLVTSCSDMFFSSRHNLLFPQASLGMHDGWETRRSRREGFDWAVVKLAARGRATRIVVDTSQFKGNSPESFALDGAASLADADQGRWQEIFARTPLRPHTRHVFPLPAPTESLTHARLRIFPDGGISRLRLYGRLDVEEQEAQRVRRLDAMPADEAERAFLSCCGSHRWARAMSAARPFSSGPGVSSDALTASAHRAFDVLAEGDWLEAFAAHPRIGGQKPAGEATAASKSWSAAEQAGVGQAAATIKDKLAAKNEEYLARFGFIFIVMASGKSAEEMLALLETRLGNDRDTELANAAAEQRKITLLRLSRLQ